MKPSSYMVELFKKEVTYNIEYFYLPHMFNVLIIFLKIKC